MINKIIHKARTIAKDFELGVLEKRAESRGYDLKLKTPVSESEVVIQNFFKTDFNKNALISYIIYPFVSGIQNYHSNVRECFVIAEILREFHFNVDIIHWDNTTYLPLKQYDVVIDNHNNLQRLLPYLPPNAKKIFHATNANWLYQNWIEYGRYYEFFINKGVSIAPPRITAFANSFEYCDAISMFGNDFTKNTYGEYANKVTHVPMSVTTVPQTIDERNFSSAKTKFVWLNSHGALLKGLDVVLGAFATIPHLELIICGDLNRDASFRDVMAHQLQATNITVANWVDIESEAFLKIATECAWVISTSFSEGGGGSTLNCMAKGLIPIVSRETSLTLPINTGFYLEKNNAFELAELLKQIVCLQDPELKEMSFNAYTFVSSNHTIENFRLRYTEFLGRVLRAE